jgi:hypothetical protein
MVLAREAAVFQTADLGFVAVLTLSFGHGVLCFSFRAEMFDLGQSPQHF